MNTTDLALVALAVIGATWRFPGLRILGVMIGVAVAVLPYTNTLPKIDRAFVYIPLDVIGGLVGAVVWVKWREPVAVLFLVFSLLACVAHLAVFLVDHGPAQQWWYIATLNGLFLLSCLTVGGAGFARLHRHLPRSERHRVARHATGLGG